MFRSEKGLGEAGRAVWRAVSTAGVPHVLNDVPDEPALQTAEPPIPPVKENPYRINLAVLNPDKVLDYFKWRPRPYFQGRYHVGVWNWELERFPEAWCAAFVYFDEIWAPSEFTRRSIAERSPVPVHVVPYCVTVPPAGRASFPAELGVPAGRFVFLTVFDYQSYVARKNPLAVIEAFRRAFPEPSGPVLVVKSAHSDFALADAARVRRSCAGRPDIVLLDRVMTRAETDRLFASCDALVSLHRSEGFGFPVAEAMAAGKPVIVTDYSGTTDFFTGDDGLPVRCALVPIRTSHGPYSRGGVWADADVDDAAAQMRRLVADPDLAARLGARAREVTVARLSAERVGEAVSRRLSAIVEAGPPRLRRKPWTAREIGQRVWGRVRPPIRVRRALGFST
jgi:glycosyltransferase involved in cell wall biosynthesis